MRTGVGALTTSINDRLFDELDAPVLRLASQDIPTLQWHSRATDDCAARANCGSSAKMVACVEAVSHDAEKKLYSVCRQRIMVCKDSEGY